MDTKTIITVIVYMVFILLGMGICGLIGIAVMDMFHPSKRDMSPK